MFSTVSNSIKFIPMYKTVILCLLSCLFLNTISAQTFVSGGIYSDVTWSLANSPYIVTGDVVVFPNKTLTIEPGVEVRVKGAAGITGGFGITIEVRGQLDAVGTQLSPITFRGDSAIAAQYLWGGIYLKASQGGDANLAYIHMANARTGFTTDAQVLQPSEMVLTDCEFMDNYIAFGPDHPVRFVDCLFEGNGICAQPIYVGGANVRFENCDFDSNQTVVSLIGGSVTANDCRFRNNGFPIAAQNVGSINNCLFENNTSAVMVGALMINNTDFIGNGTALWGPNWGAVTNCRIINNGVGIEIGNTGRLYNTEITGNGVGVKIYDNPIQFANNRICGNTLYNVENTADRNIDLVGNCFCESDSSLIEELLFDGYDDISRGLFNYAIYDSTCINIVQLVAKVLIPTSIVSAPEDRLSIYPNPAQDVLNVRFAGNETEGMLRVINLQGQVLLQVAATQLVGLDVSSLPAGIYLLDYRGTSHQVSKWVKE
jgi:hypothetical protein